MWRDYALPVAHPQYDNLAPFMANKIHLSALAVFASIALFGCSTSETLALHPVDNEAPGNPVGVYEMREVDVGPQLRIPRLPRYPSELRKMGIDGESLILFTVKADGTVADAVILTATDIRFGEAGRESILKWQFKPALLKGRAVDCRIKQKLVFTAVSE